MLVRDGSPLFLYHALVVFLNLFLKFSSLRAISNHFLYNFTNFFQVNRNTRQIFVNKLLILLNHTLEYEVSLLLILVLLKACQILILWALTFRHHKTINKILDNFLFIEVGNAFLNVAISLLLKISCCIVKILNVCDKSWDKNVKCEIFCLLL